MKKKMGWTSKGIIGFIFAPIGALFTLIAFLVWILKPEWDDPIGAVIFQSVFGGLGLVFLFLGLGTASQGVLQRNLRGGGNHPERSPDECEHI